MTLSLLISPLWLGYFLHQRMRELYLGNIAASLIYFGGETLLIKNDTVILISPLLFYFLNQTIHELYLGNIAAASIQGHPFPIHIIIKV